MAAITIWHRYGRNYFTVTLCIGNHETQSVVLEVGLTRPLWSVVQRSPDISVKENALCPHAYL